MKIKAASKNLHDLIIPNREFDSTFKPLKSDLKVDKIFVKKFEKCTVVQYVWVIKSDLKVGKI